jgi:hypothetical protein
MLTLSRFIAQSRKGVRSFRLRPSSEALQILYAPLVKEWPRLPFTARIGRAQFHCTRPANKKGTWPLLPHPSEGSRAPGAKKAPHTLAPHLRRPHVARAQKIIRLHPLLSWRYQGRACSCWNEAALGGGLETICETRRIRVSITRGPDGFEDGWSQHYSTSTVMVSVAVTRSWSFVAPFTVIL